MTPVAPALQSVKVQSGTQPLHNYFTIEKFYKNEGLGQIVNRYKQRMLLLSEDFLAGVYDGLTEDAGTAGDVAGEILHACGYAWGKSDIQVFEQRCRQEFGRPIEEMIFGMVLETWWWPLRAAGWGGFQFDLSHRQEGLIFVDVHESAVARALGKVGKPVCHLYAGLFAAVFGHLARRDLSSLEIQCFSAGADCCKFVVGSTRRLGAAQSLLRAGATAQDVLKRLQVPA